MGHGRDLQIYHNGSHSYIEESGTGNLYIRSSNTRMQSSTGEDQVLMTEDGAVQLYHDNVVRLTTNSTGLTIGGGIITSHHSTLGGHLYPDANNTRDIGSTSYRWANIYTNDLHLSNEGSSNDVDGTWGDWTIQEGESDLFLKNNRSGKKYKFNLTEVS